MDRNQIRNNKDGLYLVALLAEGVDRNKVMGYEIQRPGVALLAEGVDRNKKGTTKTKLDETVALLAEGVDRNNNAMWTAETKMRRPPRGGRG